MNTIINIAIGIAFLSLAVFGIMSITPKYKTVFIPNTVPIKTPVPQIVPVVDSDALKQRILKGAKARQELAYNKTEKAYSHWSLEIARLSEYPEKEDLLNKAKITASELSDKMKEISSYEYLQKMIEEETLNPQVQVVEMSDEVIQKNRQEKDEKNAAMALAEAQIIQQQIALQQQAIQSKQASDSRKFRASEGARQDQVAENKRLGLNPSGSRRVSNRSVPMSGYPTPRPKVYERPINSPINKPKPYTKPENVPSGI